MFRKLFFALIVLLLAGALTACNGEIVPPVTVEPTAVLPTEVPPTAVPSPTPTTAPTAVPTEEPTPTEEVVPTATSVNPTVWEIAEQMLGECIGSHPLLPDELEIDPAYKEELEAVVLRTHQEFAGRFFLTTNFVVQTAETTPSYGREVLSPFAFLDFPEGAGFFLEETACEGYVLAREDVPENYDRDGILIGEAYLFYEVGGTEPYVLDGELREVYFVFPAVP